MSLTRSELHLFIEESIIRGLIVNKDRFAKLDSGWQEWALKNTDPGFKMEHPREKSPKVSRWDWIDELYKLNSVRTTYLHFRA
jgi:hypothetical protein